MSPKATRLQKRRSQEGRGVECSSGGRQGIGDADGDSGSLAVERLTRVGVASPPGEWSTRDVGGPCPLADASAAEAR